MVRMPSCNIGRPIYIWRMEIKLKDTHTSLHICIQGLSLVHPYLQQPHCKAIKKGSLWNKLAWWPLPASSIPMPPLSPTTNHHHAPLLFILYPLSWDIISFYTRDYSRMGQSQQLFYKENASWYSVQCTNILLVLLQKTKLVMMVCVLSVISDH